MDISKAAAAGELTSMDQLKPALAQCGFCHKESGFRD
jgi:cytochrome c553